MLSLFPGHGHHGAAHATHQESVPASQVQQRIRTMWQGWDVHQNRRTSLWLIRTRLWSRYYSCLHARNPFVSKKPWSPYVGGHIKAAYWNCESATQWRGYRAKWERLGRSLSGSYIDYQTNHWPLLLLGGQSYIRLPFIRAELKRCANTLQSPAAWGLPDYWCWPLKESPISRTLWDNQVKNLYQIKVIYNWK